MFKAFDFCLPTLGKFVPSGPEWFHEIKYDGYRLSVERDGERMRLCRGLLLRFGASLGVVQLFHLSPRQRRGFLDGLLSHEGVGVQPA
jgi:hypothetical protein